MTGTVAPEDRILLALVAVFAPGQAERLLSRLALPEADLLRTEGARMAGLPRRARLLSLSESLASLESRGAYPSESLAVALRPSGRSASLSNRPSRRNPGTCRRHAT
jgi:hypothetical protein